MARDRVGGNWFTQDRGLLGRFTSFGAGLDKMVIVIGWLEVYLEVLLACLTSAQRPMQHVILAMMMHIYISQCIHLGTSQFEELDL